MQSEMKVPKRAESTEDNFLCLTCSQSVSALVGLRVVAILKT